MFSRMSPLRGVDEHVVGPAGDLQMAVGFEFRGRPVVDHVVGANHVIAVVDHHVASQRERIAGPLLVFRFPFHGSSGFGRRFRHGLRHQFLAGIVGQRRPGGAQRWVSRRAELRSSHFAPQVPHWLTLAGPVRPVAGDRRPAA